MSFLFSWTKYFRSSYPTEDMSSSDPDNDEESGDESQTQSKQLIVNNTQQHIHENEDDNKLSDDEADDNFLDGEEFETLEQEIEFLRQQNAKLKEKYKFHKSQHKLFRHNLQKTGVVTMKINGKLVNLKQPQYQMSLDELSAKVEARLPKFLQKDDQNNNQANDTIYVPSDVQNEIGIIDIQSVDMFDVVKYDTMDTKDALSTFNQNDSNLQFEETETLGGPFIVLRESDIIDAIACFVAQCVIDIPECRNLDEKEMLSMISGTFSELKSKGPLGKMMDWGSFVYSTYGYTATAYTVYSNAAMARTILSCLVSAAWLIGVL